MANRTGGAAIVTTLRNAGATIDSFIAYHLAIGFAHFFLFFDDPADPDLARLGAHPAVTCIAHDAQLRRSWTSLPHYAGQSSFVDSEVMARQTLNVELAMTLARDAGFSWLLHIDSDELFYSPHQSAGEHFAAEGTNALEVMGFPNFEAVPESDGIGDFFREVDLFKVPPALWPQPVSAAALLLVQATPQLMPNIFHFYACGKSAVNLSATSMRPLGVHSFVRDGAPYRGAESTRHFILHYACCGFENFWTKYATLGRFADKWWNRDDIAAGIGPLHLEARDIVATGGRDAARAFYRRRIAIADRQRIAALAAFGILKRFSQPRQILAAAGSP